MAAINELELQGYKTEVWAVWRNETDYPKIVRVNVDTLIKPTYAPWQPSLVAFALCNPAFQRRLCWKVAETLEHGHKIAGGYGHGAQADMSDFDIAFCYHTQEEERHNTTPADALKRATEIVKEALAKREAAA